MKIRPHSIRSLTIGILLLLVQGGRTDSELAPDQFRTIAQLEAALAHVITAACGSPAPAFEIARAPLCDLTQGTTYQLITPTRIEGGRNWFQLQSDGASGSTKSYLLPVELYWNDDVWVAVRPLQRGACLGEEDIIRKLCRHAHPRAEIEFPQAPIGLCLTAPLASGGILTHALLESPPMVARGSIVRLVYRSPGLRIAAKAKVLEDGRLGDAIRVKPLDARRVCQAVVQNAHEVEVIVP